MRSKIIGLATALAIFASGLVATPAYANEDPTQPAEIPSTTLPEAPLVETVTISTDQTTQEKEITKVTAKTDAAVEKTNDSISIVNADTNETVKTCDTGTLCEYDYTNIDYAPEVNFFARTTNFTSNSVQVLNANPIITLTSDTSQVNTEELFALDAVSSESLPAGKRLYITSKSTGEILKDCGGSCGISITRLDFGEFEDLFVAYIADNAEIINVSQLTGVVAESNTVQVSQTPWNFRLTTDTPYTEDGEAFYLISNTNQWVPSGYKIYYYDLTKEEFVISTWAETNHTCYTTQTETKCGTHIEYDKQRVYQGYIAKIDENITAKSSLNDLEDVRAISNTLTVRQLPWILSVEETETYVFKERKYKAHINQVNRFYYAAMVNMTTGEIYSLCTFTALCETEPDHPVEGQARTEGLALVIGRWSGDTTGKEAPYTDEDMPGGYMYDIQASYTHLSPSPNTPTPPRSTRPSLSGPSRYSGGSNPSEPCAQTCVADPVNTVTGEFWLNRTDATVDGSVPLIFSRYYGISKRNTLKDMGYGWNSNYDMKITPQSGTNLETSSTLTVSQENGSTISFTKNAAGGYSTNLETKAALVKSGTNFVVTRDKKTTFTFNSAGLLISIKDLNGNTTTLNYTNGKLATAVNNKGQQLTFTWNTAGLLASVTTPAGKTTSYGYSAGKNLNKVTYPDGRTETFVHNGEHMIMDMFDAKNNKTTNTYDADKRVTAQIDPMLNKTVFTYESNLTTITQPNGRKDKHHFNTLFQVYRIQTAAGDSTEYNEYYDFDAAGNTISVTYPDGGTVESLYDANGNVVQSKDRAGNISKFTYNSLGLLLTETNPAGKVRSNTYDAKGNRLTSTDYKNNITSYVVNADGTVQSITSPDGSQNTFTYSTNGMVSVAKDALNNATTHTFNADGEALTTTNAKGNVQSLTYDAAGRVTKTIYPNLSEETVEYDANSNVIKSTNRLGKSTTQKVDALDRTTSITDPAGNIVSSQYDKMGNIVKTVDQLGKETATVYNLLNQPTSTTNANGKKTEYSYDKVGNLIRTTDANGKDTVYNYDASNRLIQTVQPNGVKTDTAYNNLGLPTRSVDPQRNSTNYTYDDNGNLTKTTLPNQSTTQIAYDSMNRQTQFTDGDGGIKKWSYDIAGRTKTFTNTNNTVTSYTYDVLGNLLTELRPGNTTATYEYSNMDQMTKEIYSDSTTEFVYDTAGRLMKERQGSDEVGYSYDDLGNISSRGPPLGMGVSYTYTPRNEVASITYPSGKKVAYTYDNVGNLLTAVNAQTGTFTYTYNNVSALASESNPNGTQQTYTYDSANQLTETLLKKNLTTLYKKQYSYSDRSGLVESSRTKLSSSASDVDESYTYDNMSRLASNTSNQTTSGAYKYSNTGNLTTKLDETQTFNTANQITSSNVKKDATYTSDIRGNRTLQKDAATNVTDRNYAYNQRNQLAGTGASGETVYYAYDANGLLKRRTKNAVDKRFTWDYSSSIPTLLDDGDYEYIYTTGTTPAAQINKTTGAVTYLHTAESGSVVSATNATGDVVGAYAYTAYGDIETPAGVVDPQHTQTRFGYAGEWKDPETGLYNLRARWYEPTTGSFLTRDPLEQSTNEAYSYASGNPYLYTDPLGLFSIGDVWDAQLKWLERDDVKQGLSIGITIIAAAGAIACTLATAGICGGVIASTLIVGGLGAAASTAEYSLTGKCQTAAGYLGMAAFGAVTGGKGKAATTAVKTVVKTSTPTAIAGKVPLSPFATKGLTYQTATDDILKASANVPKTGDYVIYLRTHPTTKQPYVGKSTEYAARMKKHDKDHGVNFKFDVLGRTNDEAELARMEEYLIRAGGGATKRVNPHAVLANRVHGRVQYKYDDLGGDF